MVDASPYLRLWIEEVRLPDGRIIDDFYLVEQRDLVVVFALTGKDQVIGMWHYKHGPCKVDLGFPAGYLAEGETALDATRRELLEETGYCADSWRELGSFTVDGNRNNGTAHYFLARNSRRVARPNSDGLEEISIELINLNDVSSRLHDGVATVDAAAVIGLALTALRV